MVIIKIKYFDTVDRAKKLISELGTSYKQGV